MFDKLELESDPVEKSNYTEMLNKTVKSVIDRKLPDRKDIDTIYKLKQASMELCLYDAIPENHRSNRKEVNKRRKRGNYKSNKVTNKVIIKNITAIEITTTVIIILARIRIIIHNYTKIRLNP